MNTMLRSSTTPNQTSLAPTALTATGRPVGGGGGIHKGIWMGGALMALTIVALATTLIVKGNSAVPETAAPLAAVPATTAASPDASTMAPPPVVAQQQAPVAMQAPVQAPVHATHHASTHSPAPVYNGNSGNNTQVAAANTAPPAPVYNEPARVAAPVCTTCGVIESYDSVQVAGQANGVGAVAGGLGGAVLGSKIAGRGNHTLGGVLGAVGGGLLGNVIEKHERTSTAYDVHVRMNDGSMRTVRQSSVPNVGSHVSVEGNSLRAAPAQSSNNGYGNGNGQSNGNGGSSFSPSGN